jgi:hypothetical protein
MQKIFHLPLSSETPSLAPLYPCNRETVNTYRLLIRERRKRNETI